MTGRTTLTRADGDVLFKATRARVGFFNQARLLSYAALVATLSAILAIQGYGRTPKVLLGLAIVLFAAAVAAGLRTTAMFGRRYGHGGEREIVVGDDEVEVRETGLTVSYAWPRFDHAYETSDHLVLLAGPGVVVLPKRAFSPDDLGRVRALVASKLTLRAM